MTEFEDKISLMIPAYLRGDLGVEDRAEVDAALLLKPSLYAPVSALVADAQVKIGLSDGLTASELTERLTDLNGQIVSGPSALGLYTIGFEDASACDAALPGLADIADVPSGCG